MLNTILGSCFNIVVDGICLDPKKSPADSFVRRSFFRTDVQIEEFLNSYVKLTDYIMAGIALPPEKQSAYFYQNTTQCANYGGCQYCALCKHGMQETILLDFQQGDNKCDS
jgi:hypothetical protein